ncbi:MAG TPA: hypothetical protein VMY36_02010 [Patescibacteria group bacterium]|nr:hypothetical protein [Patescibacteria group bacterium]
MESRKIIKKLKSLSNPKNVEGMIRFGINSKNIYGVTMPFFKENSETDWQRSSNIPTALGFWNL